MITFETKGSGHPSINPKDRHAGLLSSRAPPWPLGWALAQEPQFPDTEQGALSCTGAVLGVTLGLPAGS